MSDLLKLGLLATMLAIAGVVIAGTPPVAFETSDLDGLYRQLDVRRPADLAVDEQRELALLILMRAGQARPANAAALAAAKARLATLATASGNDPEILAIAANVRAMEAGLATSPMAALVISKEVTRTLDRLVRDHPGNGGVLMQRGSNALYSPEIAGRGSIAVADFETLVNGDFDLGDAACMRSMELLGRAYQKVGRTGDARQVYTKISQSRIPYWQRQGQTLLNGLGR